MNLDSLQLVVFESQSRRNFEPLSLSRPTFDLMLGSRTILERTEDRLKKQASALFVPKYLEQVCKEAHPNCKINETSSGASLAVNSLVSPRYQLAQEIQRSMADYGRNFVVIDSRRNIVFAVLENLETGASLVLNLSKISKKIPARGDQASLLVYPWHLVSENEFALEQDYASFSNEFEMKRDFADRQGPELLGGKNLVSRSAEVERFVTVDSRGGPVIVDDGALIQSFSHIQGPCYIGKSSVIRSAKIREGTTIGKECRVGGEVEASIVHDYSNKNHDGFLGHSIIGSWANLGALTTNSDLKNTYGKIKVKIVGREVNTGSIKVGCFLSDMCKTSIGTLILSGKSVGVGSNVFGVVSENIPSFTLYSDRGKSNEIYLESAIETQKRMMERRGVTMTSGYVQMVKSVFKITLKDRKESHVKRGKFKI